MTDLRKKLKGKTTKLAQPRKNLEDHPANLNYFVDGSFYKLPIETIIPDPNQPRKIFDPETLAELSKSIQQTGVLQPIIVRRDQEKEGKFWLIAGERRFRAAKMANLEAIPAIISTGNPAEISLIENLQRENLKPIEEAEALSRMIKEYGYTQEQLANVIGKARNTVTQTLSLNKLPEEIKKECPHADIPKRVLIEIARKETPAEMISLFSKVKDGYLNANEVRENVRKRTRKIESSPIHLVISKTQSLYKSLTKLDMSTILEADREVFLNELSILENAVKKILELKY